MPGTVGPSPLLTSSTKGQSKTRKSSQEKKSSGPTSLSRRTTPQHLPKSSSGKREKEREHEAAYEDESFLNYCTYCEKQINSHSNTFLYCSEACRQQDLSTSTPSYQSHAQPFSSAYNTPPRSPYTSSFSPSDGPDIVPRASPSTARPRSYYTDDLASSAPQKQSSAGNYTIPSSLPQNGNKVYAPHSSALASLRTLSTALESTRPKGSSPRSSRSNSLSTSSDGSDSPRDAQGRMWGYMSSRAVPRAQYTNSASTPATSSNSVGSSGYSAGYTYAVKTDGYAGYGNGNATYSYTALARNPLAGVGTGMDRPLPPRSGGVAHRPKSVDLVTPFSSGA